MKTFDECCEAYHEVMRATADHALSALGVEIRNRTQLDRLNAYLDLSNWPHSPLQEGLDEQARDELAAWGETYSKQLSDFDMKKNELCKQRYETLCTALEALGRETGNEYAATCGAFDVRVHGVLGKADLRRKEQLDGFGFVCVAEEGAPFAKGFFKTSKLNRKAMLADLKLCADIREKWIKATEDDLARLGFAEEVCDESR